jgi:hypothetical protein
MLSSNTESLDIESIHQNAKEKISNDITEGEVDGAIGILRKMGMIEPMLESNKDFKLTSQGRHSNPWILQQALSRIWRAWGEQHIQMRV